MLRKVSSLCALLNRLIFRKSVKSLLTFNPNTSDLEFGISVLEFLIRNLTPFFRETVRSQKVIEKHMFFSYLYYNLISFC